MPFEQWNTVELVDLGGRYKFVAAPTPKRTVEVTVRMAVPRDTKAAKEFVQKSVLAWLNKNADRKEAPYRIIIPPTGIVPEFAALNATTAPGKSGGAASAGTSEEQAPETQAPEGGGAGAMSSRNRSSEGAFSSAPRGTLGGSSGGGGSGFSGTGAGNPAGDAAAESAAAEAKKERKASRVAVKSASVDAVDIERDAALPTAPNPYAGKQATTVTIKFTVELRPPVGRELTTAAPGAAGEAPAEGAEGAQQ